MSKQNNIESVIEVKKSKVTDLDSLEQFRLDFLGKKGEISLLMKDLSQLDVEERKKQAEKLNILKNSVLDFIKNKTNELQDIVLQKATELGVTHITPLITERCAVKLDEKRWEKKQQQWQKIIQGACEQSGRNTLPILNPPRSLASWLAESTTQTRLVLSPGSQQKLSQLTANSQGFRLLIGPEGGLSESEVHQAEETGFTGCSLGPRILRTETAALASVSVLQATFGDL